MKRSVRLLALLLCLTLCMSFTVFATDDPQDVWGDVKQDNFVRITSSDAWNKGTYENTVLTEEVGNGAIRLAEGQLEGSWTSQEMDVPAFEYMVASWSSDTPTGASVEIMIRAFVDMKGDWTGWMSWGKWGTGIKRGSANTSDALAYVDTDILTIKGSSGETASKIQVKAVLRTVEGGKTPTLRDISATSKNTLDGQAIPIYYPNAGIELPEKVILDTPAYSQMRRDGSIGGVICSPTTMTMMINDRAPQLDLFPEELALRDYDFNYEGFGNWAYTTAVGAAYGFSASCHYSDLDFVRHELAAGRSVGLSVRYNSVNPSGSYYLENGATDDTAGHLITIVGYETIDGVDYFYSNDAATRPDAKCALRKYRADQLDNCWQSRLAYTVSLEPEVGAGQDAPQRIPAKLEQSETNPDGYRLMVDGEQVVLNKSFLRKTSVTGAGTAFLIAKDAPLENMPEGMKVTTANTEKMTYVGVTNDGDVYISTSKMQAAGMTDATCYIIVNDGPTYVAEVTIPAKEEAPTEPATEAPTQAPTEAPTQAPTEAPTEAPAEAKGGMNPAIIVVGVAIVAAAAVVLVKSRKK